MAWAWYSPEHWERIREIIPDRDDMPLTYAEWLAMAEEDIRDLQAKGIEVHRMQVHPDMLLAWAGRKGLSLGSHNRIAFAVELLLERLRPKA